MLVVMKRSATQKEIDAVIARIQEFGITPVPLPGAERMAIGTFGSTSRAAADAVEPLPGVAEVVPVSRPFKLASREVIPEDSVVNIGAVPIGGASALAVMAGPCSIESRDQTLATARCSTRPASSQSPSCSSAAWRQRSRSSCCPRSTCSRAATAT
jgi:3-deoxy-7-phosphoheptulonate synthase